MTDSYNTASQGGIKKRISQLTGFMPAKINISDSSSKQGKCEKASFVVNGVGFSTNFETYERKPELDTSTRFKD